MIPVSEAISIVTEQTPVLDPESVELTSALGRFLAEDVVADSDLPPFDRSQMDGYALRASDLTTTPVHLKVVGESAAGKGWHNELQPGQAVRIMTGAPVPTGADSVQQVELTREINGQGEVEILQSLEVGRSIVKCGSEIKAGERVLEKGERIDPAMMAVLASFGYAKVRVGRRPQAAVLATGSELVGVAQTPGQDQIRDSNNYSIEAYASLAGALVKRLPLATDDTSVLKKQLAEAADAADVVITSGGVSMGVYDFTKSALKERGAEIFFERISLKPGKPMVFARMPSGALAFALPGNPVSVSVTFNLFARAALLKMQGAAKLHLEIESAFLAKDVKGAGERESYLPARVRTNSEGRLIAEPLKWGGSSDFVSFARATALIIVPANVKLVEASSIVKIARLPT
jgi:molybdenum cofactor synthesis domain-containing protein